MWEYKIVRMGLDSRMWEQKLNELGLLGWELVGFGLEKDTRILKRPLE